MRTFQLLIAAILVASGIQAEEHPQPEGAQSEASIELLAVKRIYIDNLTGGEPAAQMRDMLMASLHASKLFVVTERQDRADAILRGAAEDLIYTDVFQTSEGVTGKAYLSGGRGAQAGERYGERRSAGASVGEHESTRIQERRHEAVAAVRLVNRDGDVIWSTTQESKGAKFRGASADVADRIMRKLSEDIDRAKRASTMSFRNLGTPVDAKLSRAAEQ